MYLIQPIFFLWILLGLLAHNSISGSAIAVQPFLLGGASGLDLEMGGMCIATLSAVWLYRLTFSRSFRDFFSLLREVLIGTTVIINNIVYVSWYVLASPWLQKVWKPMKKQCLDDLPFLTCFQAMLPSTIVGGILLFTGICIAPMWTLLASPILIGFLLGSITVYWTSKRVTVQARTIP
jgi:hypothetical protein